MPDHETNGKCDDFSAAVDAGLEALATGIGTFFIIVIVVIVVVVILSVIACYFCCCRKAKTVVVQQAVSPNFAPFYAYCFCVIMVLPATPRLIQ